MTSGEAVGQVEFADHDFDVDAEIVFFAEDFDDTASRALRGAGPIGDFYVDDYPFQTLPVIPLKISVASGLVADYAIWRFFPRVGFLPMSAYVNVINYRGHRGSRFYFLRVLCELRGKGSRNFHSPRNDDFLRDFFINGFDVIMATIVVEDANDRRMSAVNGAKDAPVCAAIRTEVGDFDEHAIAMHG